MQNPRCRTKAMKIAAVTQGVTSVALEGPERDQLVVVGIGVDSATLANLLRRKVGKTTFISVAEVKPDLATKSRRMRQRWP
uniref:HMA domain-containing protein n=1 Tax=Kalanchoe fedtschenkoi TaxID=63787 RepID=A0A7N0SVT4_KALFE